MVMGWWSGRHAHLQGSGGPVPSAAPGLCAHILTSTPGESIRAPFLRPLPSPLASRPGLECARYRNVTQCCTMPWHRAPSTGTSRRFMPRLARRWPRCATREPQSCARTQVRSPHYSYVAHAMLISHPVLPFHPLWRRPFLRANTHAHAEARGLLCIVCAVCTLRAKRQRFKLQDESSRLSAGRPFSSSRCRTFSLRARVSTRALTRLDTHTHTRARARTHTRTHIHTHSPTHTPTHPHTIERRLPTEENLTSASAACAALRPIFAGAARGAKAGRQAASPAVFAADAQRGSLRKR